MNRLLASLLLLLPTAAFALKADREQDLNVSANHTEAELTDNGSAVLTGDVTITQGSLKIHADAATLRKQAGEIASAVLTGKPATVEQTLDSGGLMHARAGKIDYDMKANVLVLSGDVVVTQPEGDLRGERVRYEIDSGRMEGGNDGGRIQMTIKPKTSGTPAN